MMCLRTWLVYSTLSALILLPPSASALTPGPDDAYVRVVDVGAGLCTITEIPGPHYMVYDAGHWTSSQCLDAARDIIDGDDIDLLIVSHSDSDHLGELVDILGRYNVQRIIRTGTARTSATWRDADAAIAAEANSGAVVNNLQDMSLTPGTQFVLGEAVVTFVVGWGSWPGDDLSDAERNNVVSIVVRLAYRGNSVLFTGDTVGRHIDDPASTCSFAEQFMFENSPLVPLRSDVLIAPHHGADNGSSNCFITAVDPEFVIFSAGSVDNWGHPRQVVVDRYTTQGVALNKIFRTDRGDDEPGSLEWKDANTIADCNDGRGDDDIEIVLPRNGRALVDYRQPASACDL